MLPMIVTVNFQRRPLAMAQEGDRQTLNAIQTLERWTCFAPTRPHHHPRQNRAGKAFERTGSERKVLNYATEQLSHTGLKTCSTKRSSPRELEIA